MSTLARSWNLVKASWNVLLADKELIVFPLISAIAALGVALAFAVPGFILYSAGGNEILGYVLLFLFYLAQYTVIIFANSALVGAAMIRLRGGDPTVGDGFQIAFSRFGAIIGYALIASTVGMILQALTGRGTLANIVRSIIGTAWNIATYLVVPVLVVENVGPIEAVKRSASLLKRTWGEQIAGGGGMGLVFFLFFLLATILAGAVVVLGVAANVVVLIVGGIVLGVFAYIALALISSTLGGIYSAAVYRYAAEGEMGGQFAPDLIRNAFRAGK
ncbi:MAG: hypothetical protein HY868_22190 [Chloroflexi bacterium]|nr:hypothetical protein [Chloroflexota bacterium]